MLGPIFYVVTFSYNFKAYGYIGEASKGQEIYEETSVCLYSP